MKRCACGMLAVFSLLLLLSNPALAARGARDGLLLWADVVLPTLLPFMICSGVIVALDAVSLLTLPVSPVLQGLLGLSAQGSYVLLSGLLCGYPMGAKTDSDFLSQGRISPSEARLLLAVSNHPSPMFLLGYVVSLLPVLPGPAGADPLQIPWWDAALALYFPIFPLTLLARMLYRPRADRPQTCGQRQPSSAPALQTAPCAPLPFSFDAHLMSCFDTMTKIGGYMMLFSILALYLSGLPLPGLTRPLVLGAVEITTGIQAIARTVPGVPGALLIIASAAFGGVSGIFQTKSVMQNAGLSVRHYICWKLLHSLLSTLLFYWLLVWNGLSFA